MNEKCYKARVEISLMVEIPVWAIHEDNAAAIAEDIAAGIAMDMTEAIEESGFDHVVNHGVHCTEVEEV